MGFQIRVIILVVSTITSVAFAQLVWPELRTDSKRDGGHAKTSSRPSHSPINTGPVNILHCLLDSMSGPKVIHRLAAVRQCVVIVDDDEAAG